MKTILRSSLALMTAFAVTSCDAFKLSGPKLDEDPNIAQEVLNPGQLFLGIHAAQANFQEGNAARTVCMWLQHCAGIDRQYTSYEIYSVGEDDFSNEWGWVYAAGGLQDTRKMRALAIQQQNPRAVGVSQFMEALAIGTAATLWGDVPYSNAIVEGQMPTLDKQLDVYDAMQRLLDSAIVNLGGGGQGLGTADLIYGGNYQNWVRAAWTLKARYHMATAEVRGNTAYTAALTAAMNGIQSPAGDWKFYHGTTPTEWNMWYQFTWWDRFGYLGASATMVDTMYFRDDPRLIFGCDSGDEWCAAYWAYDWGSPPGGFDIDAAWPSAVRLGRPTPDLNFTFAGYDGDYRQPIITWAENQLIIAEASHRLAQPGTAFNALNAVRVASDRDPLTMGEFSLREIQVEQWLTMFQNIELWNYWRRSCEPHLTPARGNAIPSRLLYPLVERNANPNIPDPSAQPARNQNDPNPCH
jgi:starch-binding outer membrane protein, SusD/RagB family